MSGFGYAIAGAMQGLGKGIVEDAIAKRDFAFREAEAQNNQRRALELDNNQNANLMAREEANRSFETVEKERGRQFEASENEKQRRQYLNDEEGNVNVIEGDKARPVMGADGKPLRGTPKGGDRETDFDKRYRLGLELYGDKKKAADFASGVRDTSPEKREDMAQELAKARSQSPLGGIDSKKFDSELERARKELEALFSSDTRRTPESEATGSESEPGSKAKVDALDEKIIKQKYPDAQKAPDGNWYIKKPDGRYERVVAG
jgi:hypothetical protein